MTDASRFCRALVTVMRPTGVALVTVTVAVGGTSPDTVGAGNDAAAWSVAGAAAALAVVVTLAGGNDAVPASTVG